MHFTIKIHEGFTPWDLLPYGPDKNVPLQIYQLYYSNYHKLFLTYYKIISNFEELVQIIFSMGNFKEGKAIKFKTF